MSRERRYTAGPWIPAGPAFGGGRVKFFDSVVTEYDTVEDTVCDLGDWPNNREEQNANAHLIAAAPALLRACEWVIDSIEGGATTPEESIAYIRAAIAKAYGEDH